MEISTTTTENQGRVGLSGRFDAHHTADVRRVIDGILASGIADITIELSDVLFIDSSALAELVRGMKHCREQNGDLIIFSPSGPVQVILELTGLVKAFSVVAAAP